MAGGTGVSALLRADGPPVLQAGRYSDLKVRILSAAVLITIALADFWAGGIYVVILVLIAVVLMLWEFRRLFVGKPMPLSDPALLSLVGGGALGVIAAGYVSYPVGALLAVAGAAGAAWIDRPRFWWMLLGGAYIALSMMLLVEIRGDQERGIPVILWLVCIVIAADVGAYFAGKSIGGPKLWPAVSPNKTWAGALGGLALAVAVGALFWFSGYVSLPVLVLLSVIVALASQAGDLLESWVKRRQGVKDASSLIPGHGGLLDRFDGLMGALLVYGVMDGIGFLGV